MTMKSSIINEFQSGIFSSPDCKRKAHAVAIVGYGKSEGIKYWKIRNRLE